MTFNIHHGASTENIVDLNAIAEVICSLQPDFVALQEVDKHTGRTFKKDIAAELGQKTGMNHLFRASMPFDGGFYGNAVLSRYPIIRGCRLDLPSNRDNEPRTAVEATIRLPNGNNILFVSTHLDHHKDTRDRKKQARALNRNLLPAQYPIILAGDFNDVPGSRPIRILEKKWKSTCRPDSCLPTYPSGNPTRKLDYIFVYPGNYWQVIDSRPVNSGRVSDHLPVISTIKINK